MENGENSRNYSKFKKTNNRILGNVIMKAHAKFQEASSMGNTQKSRGTVKWTEYCKSKNLKNGENSRNFLKFKKTKTSVLGSVIKKAHAEFQEGCSIGNTQKSTGTVKWSEYCQVQKFEKRRKFKKFFEI